MPAGLDPTSLSDAPLTLTTLGGANLRSPTTILLGPGKPLALVTYLALAPGRAASREFLQDLLWADLDHPRAQHALRQTVWQLRQLLGESILTGRTELRLGVPVASDRDRFLAAIETGDPDLALAIYQGDFLPDFALPGCNEFEHWAEIERSRLRAAFLRMAEMAARRALLAGRFREAQELARRMRDADRLNETGWRLLIEALMAGRDLLRAGLEAEALRTALAAEGREPEPTTTQLLASLRRAQGEAVDEAGAAPGLVAELVGREREFSAILDAWHRASRGQGLHLHLSAPAGLGKTRLLADLAHRLRSTGARLATLRANPGERTVAYAFAGELAQTLGGLPGLPGVSPRAAEVLVDLAPGLSSRFPAARPDRAAPDELPRLRLAALVEAVTAVAEEHPLAVLVDDVHWLDPESHQLLAALVHRLGKAPVLLVTTGRPGVGRAVTAPGSIEIELSPLGPAEVTELFLSLGRLGDEALVRSLCEGLHRASDGSPLLVLEALQLALDRGTLRLADGVWQVNDPAALLEQFARGNTLEARLAELEPDAAWLLLVLATAGTPLSAAELAGTMRARERLEEHLWALERKGLVRRAGASWEPAHDELADAARARESGDSQRAAHVAVAQLLLKHSGDQLDHVLQAARHFAAAGKDDSLGLAFRQAVRLARQAGDRRGNRALALAVTAGEAGAGEEAATRLVRSLPLRARLGLHSNARLAAAAAGLLAMASVGWALVAPGGSEEADARVVILQRSPADTAVVEVLELDLARRGWRGGQPIRMPRPAERIRDPVLSRISGQQLAVSPDGRTWAFSAMVDNLLTDDIFLRTGGRSRVFHSAPRDDGSPAWSPDGRSLVFVTAMWSPRGADDYDLAVAEVATGRIRRLTGTPDFDRGPAWAPHGGLIAFVRGPRALRLREACWVTPDGRREHCVPSSVGETNAVVGWLDGARVLLSVIDGDRLRLVRWDLASDRFELIFGPTPVEPVLSPDGRWVICVCARDADERNTWTIFPVDDPAALRPLANAGELLAVGGQPIAGPAPPPQVRIEHAELELAPGTTHAASAVVVDGEGARIPLPSRALHWTSTDPAVAEVDSLTGRIRTRGLGQTIVTADLGGVAQGTIRLRVRSDSAATILEESWATLDSARWLDFGVPPPRLVEVQAGQRALNNNGDGSYDSGVFSRRAFSAVQGLGLEARVSVPVSRAQWQSQTLALRSERSHPTARWDRRTGAASRDVQHAGEECSFSYPAGEGLSGVARLGFAGGGTVRRAAADSAWPTGAWRAVRLQIFPDGTCGAAVDGVPVWRSDARVPADEPYRIWLFGNSAGTDRILVGRVVVWQGVRQDVDWEGR